MDSSCNYFLQELCHAEQHVYELKALGLAVAEFPTNKGITVFILFLNTETQFFLKGQKQLVVRATFIQKVTSVDTHQKHTVSPPGMASRQAGPGAAAGTVGLCRTGGGGCVLSWCCPFPFPRHGAEGSSSRGYHDHMLQRFLGTFCLSSCQMKTLKAQFCFCKSRSIRHRLSETKAVMCSKATLLDLCSGI